MEAWIRNLIASGVAGVRALADATWERLAWIYNVLVAVGLSVRSGWGRLINSAAHFTGRLISAIREAYITLHWIVWIRIPQIISNTVNDIVLWATRVINAVDNKLTAFVTAVRDWIIARLNELKDFTNKLSYWIGQKVGEIVNVLNRVAALVFVLLTSPERMAEWVFEALIGKALRYVDEHAEALLDMVRARGVQYAGRIAARVEDVLVRML